MKRRAIYGESPIVIVDLPRNTDSPSSKVIVLAVIPQDRDYEQLCRIFSRSNWTLHRALSCGEALRYLQKNQTGVLVCASEQPDGTWESLLDLVRTLPSSPLMIVTSDHGESSLWADVLNLGAYDVLAKPFDKSEVIRIISLAWLQWRDDKERVARRPVARMPGDPLT